jgi:SAM-dependent methyltransferase
LRIEQILTVGKNDAKKITIYSGNVRVEFYVGDVHLYEIRCDNRNNVTDKSNGYERIAKDFIPARNRTIGPRVVREWAKRLQPGTAILDVGCGYGVPISEALMHEGFTIYGVDASPTLISEFRRRFPDAQAECCPAEDSLFFNRTFDAVVAWGLMFLLPAETQYLLIEKVAHCLNRQGHFLFTATKDPWTWDDIMTELPSISLGHEIYEQELAQHGLQLIGNDVDEGENYYYFAQKL